MSDEKEITKVAENVVVQIDYTLTVDGEEIDSSKEEGPLEYLQGHANIIPGLERELDGMGVGDSKNVVVTPADGYGEFSDEAIMDVPRDDFPEEIPMEVGVQLQVTDKEGDMALATIVEVGDETVKLDMNHPLAGQELHFDVKVVGLRAATDEELAHGHVHSDHHHH